MAQPTRPVVNASKYRLGSISHHTVLVLWSEEAAARDKLSGSATTAIILSTVSDRED